MVKTTTTTTTLATLALDRGDDGNKREKGSRRFSPFLIRAFFRQDVAPCRFWHKLPSAQSEFAANKQKTETKQHLKGKDRENSSGRITGKDERETHKSEVKKRK